VTTRWVRSEPFRDGPLDTCQSSSAHESRGCIKDKEMLYSGRNIRWWSCACGRRNLVNSAEVRDACMHAVRCEKPILGRIRARTGFPVLQILRVLRADFKGRGRQDLTFKASPSMILGFEPGNEGSSLASGLSGLSQGKWRGNIHFSYDYSWPPLLDA
jgi:hypothetical protein